jgi:hypothetical protein
MIEPIDKLRCIEREIRLAKRKAVASDREADHKIRILEAIADDIRNQIGPPGAR